jgi:hypothetical protein
MIAELKENILLDLWYDIEQRHKKEITVEKHFVNLEIETGQFIEYKRMNAYVFFELLSHACHTSNQALREREYDMFIIRFINEQEDLCKLMQSHREILGNLIAELLTPKFDTSWN